MIYDSLGPATDRSDFINSLSDAIRENPVPAALVGAGILWLFMGGRDVRLGGASLALAGGVGQGAKQGGHAAYRGARFVAAGASDGIGRMAEGASQLGSRIAEGASGAANAAKSAAGDIAEQAKQMAVGATEHIFSGQDDNNGSYEGAAPPVGKRIQDSLADLFAQQPLLIGAIGLAIGAGIAASVPQSDAEDRLLGPTADEAKRRGEALWEQAKQRGSEIASRGVEEVKARGLTPNDAAEAARTIGSKVAAVAEQAGKDVADRIKGPARAPSSSAG